MRSFLNPDLFIENESLGRYKAEDDGIDTSSHIPFHLICVMNASRRYSQILVRFTLNYCEKFRNETGGGTINYQNKIMYQNQFINNTNI